MIGRALRCSNLESRMQQLEIRCTLDCTTMGTCPVSRGRQIAMLWEIIFWASLLEIVYACVSSLKALLRLAARPTRAREPACWTFHFQRHKCWKLD